MNYYELLYINIANTLAGAKVENINFEVYIFIFLKENKYSF